LIISIYWTIKAAETAVYCEVSPLTDTVQDVDGLRGAGTWKVALRDPEGRERATPE